jgi:hypothetical protein
MRSGQFSSDRSSAGRQHNIIGSAGIEAGKRTYTTPVSAPEVTPKKIKTEFMDVDDFDDDFENNLPTDASFTSSNSISARPSKHVDNSAMKCFNSNSSTSKPAASSFLNRAQAVDFQSSRSLMFGTKNEVLGSGNKTVGENAVSRGTTRPPAVSPEGSLARARSLQQAEIARTNEPIVETERSKFAEMEAFVTTTSALKSYQRGKLDSQPAEMSSMSAFSGSRSRSSGANALVKREGADSAPLVTDQPNREGRSPSSMQGKSVSF